MFELENAVADWRNQITAGGVCTQADVAELEDHLREQTQRLGGGGLTPEEAFLVAARRLGDTASLTHEFRKVNARPMFMRLFWMIAGILVYLLVMSASAAVAQASVTIGVVAGLRGMALALVSMAVQTVSVMAGVLVLFLLSRAGAGAGRRGFFSCATGRVVLVGVVTIASVVSGVFARIVLPALTARLLGSEGYGRMAASLAYARFAWPVLIPMVLAVILIALPRQTHNDGLCNV